MDLSKKAFQIGLIAIGIFQTFILWVKMEVMSQLEKAVVLIYFSAEEIIGRSLT